MILKFGHSIQSQILIEIIRCFALLARSPDDTYVAGCSTFAYVGRQAAIFDIKNNFKSV